MQKEAGSYEPAFFVLTFPLSPKAPSMPQNNLSVCMRLIYYMHEVA